jgi:crotonobetainyl-CoA:carnitine CoA-transferase CaiB-like acyl-CoA transferase
VADSYIVIAAGNDSLFTILCEAIGQAELAENPLFKTNPLRTEH